MEKVHIAASPIGFLAFYDKGELVHIRLFEKGKSISKNVPSDFIKELEQESSEDEKGKIFARQHLRDIAMSSGFVLNDEEFNEFMSDFCLSLSRSHLKGSVTKDKILVQASNALEETIKMENIMKQRITEWFLLHYPECREKNLAEKIAEYGRRENFPNFRSSLGIELNEEDEKMLMEFARSIQSIEKLRSSTEKYVSSLMKEVMPNFSSLTSTYLAAKFLAKAGSLEKLSRMTASTIQLLGAEKALFRHLKKQGRSPKYGIIFNDARVQNAREEEKGKVARLLAAKLMQAARIDYYSGRDESKNLNNELDEEIGKI